MIQKIENLPEFDVLAVIINVDTKIPASLALFSAMRYTKFPVLIVDCSKDGRELSFFERLQNEYDFYLTSLPLNIHGKTIDYLFLNIKAKALLLLDSDAEILSPFLFNPDSFENGGGGGPSMSLLDDNVFGCGFFQKFGRMSNASIRGGKFCCSAERMYIPCVLLKTFHVREALSAGCSFAAKKVYNDFPLAPIISKLIYFRFFFKFFQNHDIPALRLFRRIYFDYYKPSMIYYDTGAEVYMYLKYALNYDYIGLPVRYVSAYLAHYHGITRKILNNKDRNSTSYNDIIEKVKESLKVKYNWTCPPDV
ncbi:MAG: hypothetical protein LBC53_05480 [Spirochaetaceae bacterium]|jgi:hypothetical protein|nr:hypothetical protein [Spirochaetaceae bacterium]